MSNVDNAIYHVLKTVHKNVFTLITYLQLSYRELTICSFFWLDATSRDSWQCVLLCDRLKQNQQKNPVNLL